MWYSYTLYRVVLKEFIRWKWSHHIHNIKYILSSTLTSTLDEIGTVVGTLAGRHGRW